MGARGPIVLVLAAGQGKRLASKRIKLLHDVAGQPMVTRVALTARSLRPAKLVAVIGYQGDEVRAALGGLCDAFVEQREQRGTGHAVMQAAAALRGHPRATLLILNGDLPTLRPVTLKRLLARHRASKAALSLVTAVLPDASGYGRIARGKSGAVERIVEDRDAKGPARALREINCGIYVTTPGQILPVLRGLRPHNDQGEYYLTDVVHAMLGRKLKVEAVVHHDPEEVLGVNTRAELARAARTLWERKVEELQVGGVTVMDPRRTFVDSRAKVGRDSVLWPDVIIEGPSVLGEDCVVHSGTRISSCVLGDRVLVRDHCVLAESRLASDTSVGPFAHLRPGAVLERDARVGNFVEIKKSRLGRGTKALHLSYLGDADIGPACNIGAGTITCNYDGERKNPTILEEGVFIGSDTQLVAPVKVGKGAYVAAGATVTLDVPPGALAISRAAQSNVEGWVERRKARRAARAGTASAPRKPAGKTVNRP